MCACLPVFTCVLVDLFCPPPPTTTTVLPIPPPVCPSSPHFPKFVSSGNVCGNVHKTASVGLAWAENTPPNTLPHARTIAPAPLSMLVLFFVRGCSSNHDPNLHDHSSYNPHTLPSQTPYLQPRAMCRSIALPHQVNVIKNNQSRTPPIKKTTPICLPSFVLPHMEIFHVQNIVLEPLYDPPRGLAYFDTSRGVPAYSQCPRSTEDSRCVSRYLQYPCASIFSYFHILRPQNIRKKRYISPNLGPEACLQMIIWVLRSILAQRSSKIEQREGSYHFIT